MSDRRIGWVLVAVSWIAFAWFHQGGGWNQNGRFALVRALVEEGRPWVDDFVVYRCLTPEVTTRLERIPVRDGVIETPGGRALLAWGLPDGTLAPLASAPPGTHRVMLEDVTVSGDLAFARGHLHPNKAPGTSFAAVPAYAVALVVERAAGLDPDDARVLAVNAWWAGAGSVAVVAALGVGLFWRLAVALSGGDRRAALSATLAFAFGTLYFPYATMLYEHDPTAVATLGAVALILDVPAGDHGRTRGDRLRLLAAGACLGAAIVANYFAAVTAAIVGAWLLWRTRSAAAAGLAAVGAAAPLAVLAVYNVACFGTIATTNYAWENPLFKDAAGGFLGIFRRPDPGVLAALLVSPYRGLLFGSPALLLGAAGLAVMIGRRATRETGVLFALLVLHVLAFNVTFAAWHGGWAAGPRYLVPAIPFLALPIAVVHSRRRRVSTTLIAVSIAAAFLVTAVDPQPPVGSAVLVPGRPAWANSPLLDFDLPLFLHGRLPAALAAGTRFPTGLWSGFASANPMGFYEGWPVAVFPPGSATVRGNAFNVGEWIAGEGRASLVPLLAIVGIPLALVYRRIAQSSGEVGATAR